jgi:hypothetical protein
VVQLSRPVSCPPAITRPAVERGFDGRGLRSQDLPLVVVEGGAGDGVPQPTQLLTDRIALALAADAPGKLRQQRGDASEHERIGRTVAAGLSERELKQVGQVGGVQDHPYVSSVIPEHPRAKRPTGQLAQQRAAVTERVHRGRRVVDPR